MKVGDPGIFGSQLKALRETAGFTQEELATIAGLSVHAVSALERGERRRPHVDTVRALSAALDLTGATKDAFLRSARAFAPATAVDELTGASVPLPLTPLVGRDPEIATLRQWLADPTSRLITLVGPGGVGKTRLAVELARTIADESATRVVFVSLAVIRDARFVAPAIAEALGLTDVGPLDLPRRARVACKDQPTLLVLDNFEHVLEAAPLLGELLSSVFSLRSLVTSRAPLHLRGEREFGVAPLELELTSETMSPADLARVPAVRLFVERARDVQPDFRLTPASGSAVVAICRRLDALPLALELAAPWLKVLTLDDLHRRLERDSLLANIGARDLPQRQSTMNATVAWSYQLLDPREQRAFRRVGALPGPFPIAAAEAVLAGRAGACSSSEALWAVGTLIDKSLLQRSETPVVTTRALYQMLETVRAYAALELTAAGEREDASEGLARYCVREASLAAEGLVGPAQVDWLDRVRENLESYRGALAWLIERGRADEASHIAWQLMFFWIIRGHAAEGLRWYEQILNQPCVPAGAALKALVGAAVMFYTQGELSNARSALTRAVQLANESGDREMLVHAEIVSGHVEFAGGNVGAAREWFTRSLEGFRALAIPWGVGNALSGIAAAALATGDTDSAEQLLDQATTALRDGGPWFLAVALYVRSVLAVRRARPNVAIALLRESLTRIRDLKDKFAFVAALVPLAAAAVLKGDAAWAARILGARASVIERTGITLLDDPMRDIQEHAEREARAYLGADRWNLAYAEGRRTSIDALLEDIDTEGG